jgi:hypothetical protein
MPIDAARKALYPLNWSELARSIKTEAGWQCEGTADFPRCRAVHGEAHPETGSRVVLTVAHLDHDPTHNERRNLRVLCQRCHLTWDARFHARNAARTRRMRLGNLELFEDR